MIVRLFAMRSRNAALLLALVSSCLFGSNSVAGNSIPENGVKKPQSSAIRGKAVETPWVADAKHGGVAYFLYQSPAMIKRYNMQEEIWLTDIPLSEAPRVIHVDDNGIYIGYNRRAVVLPLQGGEEVHLRNTINSISSILTAWNQIYVINGGQVLSLNREDGALIATTEYWYALQGAALSVEAGKIFTGDTGVSPSDIHMLEIHEDGSFGEFRDSPYHGEFRDVSQVYVYPNGDRVVGNNGNVHLPSDLTYVSHLGGPFDHLDFYGERPIIQRDGVLFAYSNSFQETGRFTPDQTPLSSFVHNDHIFIFFEGDDGLQAAKVSIDLLNPQDPGEPVNPDGLDYTPASVVFDGEDTTYLLSPQYLSIFRWSTASRSYLESVPLVSGPSTLAHDAAGGYLYIGYKDRQIKRINLSQTPLVEQFFINTQEEVSGLTMAGDFLIAFSQNRLTVYNSAGFSTAEIYTGNISDGVWDEGTRRIYVFSYSNLEWFQLSEAGEITDSGSMPYQNGVSTWPPLEPSPDSSSLLLGSGIILNASDLMVNNTLTNTIEAGLWLSSGLYTLRNWDYGTQLQSWKDPNFNQGPTHLFQGLPLELFYSNGQLVVITQTAKGPAFYVGDEDYNGFPEAEYPDIQKFMASETVIEQGQSVTLSWTTSGSDYVELDGEPVSASGSLVVSPAYETYYTLTAYGLGGPVSQVVLIEMAPAVISYGLTPPTFISQAQFRFDEDNNLVATLPHPNSDGAHPSSGANELVYSVTLRQNCEYYQTYWAYTEGAEAWPKRLVIPGNTLRQGDFHIVVVRHWNFDWDTRFRSDEVVVNGPKITENQGPSTQTADYHRWLLHAPKLSGGFSGLVKLGSGELEESLTCSLVGFDQEGNWLHTRQITLQPGETVYRDLYGELGLFGDFEDQISHIAIYDPSNLIDVSLRYTSVVTGFGTWTEAVDFRDGKLVGDSFEMEPRTGEAYQDGVAVLNLTSGKATKVWLAQRDAVSGEILAEVELGTLEPGAKMLSVASNLFEYAPGAKYSIETRHPSHSIQVMGLIFANGEFFAPAPVRKK